MPAGYSKRTLVQKLGIQKKDRAYFRKPPDDYFTVLGDLPVGTTVLKRLAQPLDFIQCFTKSLRELKEEFPRLKRALAKDGMLWISWPKGSAKVETDLNENIVRELGLRNGLVDIKVCAVDEVWSGLKFVYRLKDR